MGSRVVRAHETQEEPVEQVVRLEVRLVVAHVAYGYERQLYRWHMLCMTSSGRDCASPLEECCEEGCHRPLWPFPRASLGEL